MKKLILLFILAILPVKFVYAGLEMGGTAFIGGVNLFDETCPLMGINNPGLIVSYDEKNIDWVQYMYDQSAIIPKYGFGTIHLPSVYFGATFSEDSFGVIQYLIPFYQGKFASESNIINITDNFTIDIINVVKFLSFNTIDISPLYESTTNTNQSELIRQMLTELKTSDRPGAYAFYNINLFSYYHRDFGIALYYTGDVITGLFGEDRNALIIPDPSLSLNNEIGLALTYGLGERNLPIIGKADIGMTVSALFLVNGFADSIDDAIGLYDEYLFLENELNNQDGVMDQIKFITGYESEFINIGAGLSLDLGMVKEISEDLSIAANLNDIISPIYWMNNKKFGWQLPDLAFGVKYKLPFTDKFWYLMNEPTVYFQIDDLLYTSKKAFLSKLHVGVSSQFLFDFFDIGMGLNSGYPTIGFTFHFTLTKLAKIPYVKYLFYAIAPVTYLNIKWNFTFYGEELGSYPGEFGFQGYTTGFELYYKF